MRILKAISDMLNLNAITVKPSGKIILLSQADMDRLRVILQTLVSINLQRENDLLKIRDDFKKS
jgi:hypothetical protein